MEALIAWLGGDERVARVLVVGLLVAARVAPLALLAPWLSMRQAPTVLRTAVVLALTAALTPLAVESAPAIPPALPVVALLALREVLVGSLFAIATALPFYALDWAGRLVDLWRGASLAEVIAPPTGERTSPLGDLYLMMGVVLFVVLGGHRLALAAFAEGLAEVPVGEAALASGLGDVALGAMRLAANALAFGVALAAPAAVAIVLVEVSLGLVARAAPQIPVFFAGMPLRAAVGLAAALLALSLVADELPAAFRGAIDAASRLVRAAG